MKMILHLTVEERKFVVQALRILADEYAKLADQAVTRLSEQFATDATTCNRIAACAEELVERVDDATLAIEAKRIAENGNRINAIKYVREQTGWSLKSAKDYVDRVSWRDNEYDPE
jgi:ribosomal protein L7/L12